jgi:molecular chaperone DnaJ
VRISLQGEVACTSCGGSGARGGAKPCVVCRGSGRLTGRSERAGQFFTVTRACSTCHGTGLAPGETCPQCHGVGTTVQQRDLTVTIPEATRDGATLRLKGLGEAGHGGGPAGDLLVHVSVKPDPEFRQEGNTVHSDLSVPVTTAVLGGKVPVRTLRDQVMLTIPPGTSSGASLRLKHQGLVGGDHVVHVQVMVPSRLSQRERELWEELARLSR